MKKIEMPRLDYRNVRNYQHWDAYKELFEGINETLAAGKQIFVIVTAGPFTGSIMPVTMTTRFARIGITEHGYSGEFSEVYKKLMAEGGRRHRFQLLRQRLGKHGRPSRKQDL